MRVNQSRFVKQRNINTVWCLSNPSVSLATVEKMLLGRSHPSVKIPGTTAGKTHTNIFAMQKQPLDAILPLLEACRYKRLGERD